MLATRTAADPALSCVLMTEDRPPVHLRIVLSDGTIRLERRDQPDAAPDVTLVSDDDLASALRTIAS